MDNNHLEKGRLSIMNCPYCQSKTTGKIGTEHYYCWECFVEWTYEGEKITLYQVEEDGSLCCLNDLFGEKFYLEKGS
ncbi:hypothetical protein [Alteribacillus iranensis]|uniref:Uncharacterized protein n=1 Tax=Alteribacillus iranensis TaxID=930128 RepID=A0A1I1Z7J0_9BACI|nr:hypothetical protein [Alteribacillus iranensis]SFE27685.1 hypothetical protein SAMN05192532_10183 [Alteribacillus iranensis]